MLNGSSGRSIFDRVRIGASFSINPITRLLLMPTFFPLKCGIFHGIPVRIAVAPPSKIPQWLWDVKKIEIYVRASAEKNTISVQSVHNVNMKGTIV